MTLMNPLAYTTLTSGPDAGLTREVDRHGTVSYRKSDGRLHRKDGPAIERPDGYQSWYRHDKLHRKDGPAIEYPDGTREWYLNGKRHREGGPAVERSNGTREWWLNGRRHREDGPAVEDANGSREWCLGGKLHREDGPAIQWANGYREWYLNGKQLSEAEFEARRSTSLGVPQVAVPVGQVAEILEAADKTYRAAEGDSNDDEIQALQDFRDLVLEALKQPE